MRIGILTGGGDVPGLNACIKAVVNRAAGAGHEVVGIWRGWGGLLQFDPDDPATRDGMLRTPRRGGGQDDRSVGRDDPAHLAHESREGRAGRRPGVRARHRPRRGTVRLHPARPARARAPGLDALIPIGGDDTLSYAAAPRHEGFPVVAIPKTMDNDVFGTDYCIGFSTAVTRSVEFITDLRTPAGSHERIAVVELFGRNSGETSLFAAYLAGVDRAVISEVPFDDRPAGRASSSRGPATRTRAATRS